MGRSQAQPWRAVTDVPDGSQRQRSKRHKARQCLDACMWICCSCDLGSPDLKIRMGSLIYILSFDTIDPRERWPALSSIFWGNNEEDY